MSDVYTPLEARLLKYFNTPEISSQFNTVIIIKLPQSHFISTMIEIILNMTPHHLSSQFPHTHVFGATDIAFSKFTITIMF